MKSLEYILHKFCYNFKKKIKEKLTYSTYIFIKYLILSMVRIINTNFYIVKSPKTVWLVLSCQLCTGIFI